MYASQTRTNTKYTEFLRNYYPPDRNNVNIINDSQNFLNSLPSKDHNNSELILSNNEQQLLSNTLTNAVLDKIVSSENHNNNTSTKFSQLFPKDQENPALQLKLLQRERAESPDGLFKVFSDTDLVLLHNRVKDSYNSLTPRFNSAGSNESRRQKQQQQQQGGQNPDDVALKINNSDPADPQHPLEDKEGAPADISELEENLQKLNEETLRVLSRAKSNSLANLEELATQPGSELHNNVSYQEILRAEHIALRRELLNNLREISRATFYEELYTGKTRGPNNNNINNLESENHNNNNNNEAAHPPRTDTAFHLNLQQGTADPAQRVDEWIRNSRDHLNYNSAASRPSVDFANNAAPAPAVVNNNSIKESSEKPLHASLFHDSIWHENDDDELEDFPVAVENLVPARPDKSDVLVVEKNNHYSSSRHGPPPPPPKQSNESLENPVVIQNNIVIQNYDSNSQLIENVEANLHEPIIEQAQTTTAADKQESDSHNHKSQLDSRHGGDDVGDPVLVNNLNTSAAPTVIRGDDDDDSPTHAEVLILDHTENSHAENNEGNNNPVVAQDPSSLLLENPNLLVIPNISSATTRPALSHDELHAVEHEHFSKSGDDADHPSDVDNNETVNLHELAAPPKSEHFSDHLTQNNNKSDLNSEQDNNHVILSSHKYVEHSDTENDVESLISDTESLADDIYFKASQFQFSSTKFSLHQNNNSNTNHDEGHNNNYSSNNNNSKLAPAGAIIPQPLTEKFPDHIYDPRIHYKKPRKKKSRNGHLTNDGSIASNPTTTTDNSQSSPLPPPQASSPNKLLLVTPPPRSRNKTKKTSFEKSGVKSKNNPRLSPASIQLTKEIISRYNNNNNDKKSSTIIDNEIVVGSINAHVSKLNDPPKSQAQVQTTGYLKNPKVNSRSDQNKLPGFLRRHNMDEWVAKKVWFYINGDEHFPKFEYRFRPKRDVKDLDALCDILSNRLKLPRGVRHIFTIDGHKVERLEDLRNESYYVASSTKKFKVTHRVELDGTPSRHLKPSFRRNFKTTKIISSFTKNIYGMDDE